MRLEFDDITIGSTYITSIKDLILLLTLRRITNNSYFPFNIFYQDIIWYVPICSI